MAVIVDASVVVKWFVAEALHDEARELLTGREPLYAPDIVVAEVANAFWVKVGRGELDEAIALRNVTALSGDGEPQLRASVPLLPTAFELARRLAHPVYDCVYLALAEQRDAPLVTADARLATAPRERSPVRVQLLGSP